MREYHDLLVTNYERAKEERLRELVGLTFTGSVRVRVSKPRWMPDWLYLRLMRTIVVEETAPEARTT